MLSRLCVNHIALIDRIEIDLPSGFTVLTGETGAGKSIVIDAVNLAIGGRADRDLIRSGKEQASVELLFSIDDPAIANKLRERGLELEENEIILSRELTASGRSACRVNGRLGGVSLLRDASELLIDIHGQHEHQTLLRASSHLEFLDNFDKLQIKPIKEKLLKQHKAWRKLKEKLNASWGDEAEQARKTETLKSQIQEIDSAKLLKAEDEILCEERAALANAETLQKSLSAAFSLLEGADDLEKHGALMAIKWAEKQLESIAPIHPRYEGLRQRLNEAYYSIEDIALDLRRFREEATFDPYRYEEIEQRLEAIEKLKRKYGNSIAAVLQYRDDAANQLDDLEQWRVTSEEAERKLRALEDKLYQSSLELSQARHKAADDLAAALLKEFADLGMDKAQFSVQLSKIPKQSPGMDFPQNGFDEAEMLLSTNPGEPLKPLQKVASGGELSRIMLALKSVAADVEGCETLIFDEIDTGISGRIAAVVGEKMRAIARRRQVICVTHSAQIAAMADTHFLIEKSEMNEHTSSSIRKLDYEAHIFELASIVSGQDPSEQAIAHARDLVERSRRND